MRQKRLYYNAKDILSFWQKDLHTKYGKQIFSNGFIIDTNTCFACGYPSGTQRCHIIPKCKGGIDDIWNLHLLCKECHLESEFIETQIAYFEWFKNKNAFNSGSFLKMQNTALTYLNLYKKGEKDSIPENIVIAFDLLNVSSNIDLVIRGIKNNGLQKALFEYYIE